MNEITHIHLGRQSFTIAVDAHKALRQYIDDIKHQLGSKSDEVIKEIEIRMAELLTEHGVSGDKVVLSEDVAYLKEQLGSPKDFSDDDDRAEEEMPESGQASQRRLFRDTKHGMIAGVCAGLATYLRIEPVLVRIIFALSIFAGGWGILVYIILWLVVPEAKTSSEILQMQGKPITVDSLKEVVANADVQGATRRARTIAGRFLAGFARTILTFIGIGFVMAAIAVISVMISGAIYMLGHHGTVFQEGFFPVGTSEMVLTVLGLLMVTVIGVFLALAGVSLVRRKWSVPGWALAALIALFFGSMAVGAALAADAVPHVRDRIEAARHSVVRDMPEFSAIRTNGINYTRYEEGSKYAVEIRYIGNSDVSRIHTTVENGVLIVDAEDFRLDPRCKNLCVFNDIGLEVIIHAPKQPVSIETKVNDLPPNEAPAAQNAEDLPLPPEQSSPTQ